MLYQWGWGSNCRGGRFAPMNRLGNTLAGGNIFFADGKEPPPVEAIITKPPPMFIRFEDIPQDSTNLGHGCKISEGKLGGIRRSVLIGINYCGMRGELKGCINDVHRMRKFISQNGFPDGHEQYVLTDDDEETFKDLPWVKHDIPTKENILTALDWLVDGVKKGDSLFLHYSGHGVRVPDKSGDEVDGMDESIVPLDYAKSGVILDDLLHAVLVEDLPKGSRLTAIMDCCHSGSGLDLPFVFQAKTEEVCAKVKKGEENLSKNSNLAQRSIRVVQEKKKFAEKAATINIIVGDRSIQIAYEDGGGTTVKVDGAKTMTLDEARKEIPASGRLKLWQSKKSFIQECDDPEEKAMLLRILGKKMGITGGGAKVSDRGLPGFPEPEKEEDDEDDEKICGGCVVLFSGCQDEQTAGDVSSTKMFELPDASGPEGAGGACTASFLQTIAADPHQSYVDVLRGMRKDLRSKKFKQIPAISSTLAFDLNSSFDLNN